MLINGIFFHVVPVIVTRGRFSPGLFTAIVLLLPIGLTCYRLASDAGKLDLVSLVSSLLIGAALMATPIILLRIKDRPYFVRHRVPLHLSHTKCDLNRLFRN